MSTWRSPAERQGPGRTLLGYLCAVLFAWGSVDLTMRVHALRGTPVALSFIAVAAITTYFGLGPGIVSVVSTASIFYLQMVGLGRTSPYTAFILLLIGLLVAWLSDRQRRTRRRLQDAMESLQENVRTLAQAQQGSHSAAWVFRSEDRSVRWAEGGAELLGRPFEDSRLDDLMTMVHEEDRGSLLRAMDCRARELTVFRAEFRIVLPNGEVRWLEAQGTPAEKDSLWSGLVLDITSRKTVEAALLRTEKLAAIGRLSATIAHEINNPLEAVTNLHYLMAADPMLSAETRGYLTQAESEVRRLASIARHTLTFVRTKPAEGPSNPEPVAESVVAMFRARCHSRGASIRVVSDGPRWIAAPEDELRQILTNLVSNVCDALTGTDGLVQVELCPEPAGLTIRVRDTGKGIPSEDLERIFDPFFTTKVDTGTGIGLWVTKELVEKSGGTIHAESGPQEEPFRTTMTVRFPLAEMARNEEQIAAGRVEE